MLSPDSSSKGTLKPLLALLGSWALCAIALVPILYLLSWLGEETRVFAGSDFERAVRRAIDTGNYEEADRICTGAMKIWVGRPDVDGIAKLLRSNARAHLGNLSEALDDLRSSAAFWCSQPWYSNEPVREDFFTTSVFLAEEFSRRGEIEQAAQALSVAGRGTTAPGSFLMMVGKRLDASVRKSLWPESPVLRIEGFEDDTAPSLELRGTIGVLENQGYDEELVAEGKRSAFIRVKEVNGKNARVSARLHLRMEVDASFGLRFRTTVSGGNVEKSKVVYWSDGVFMTHTKVFKEKKITERNWEEYTLPATELFGELPQPLEEALTQSDLEILDIELEVSAQDGFTCHVDGIEVFTTS